jgi:hypothetical protein
MDEQGTQSFSFMLSGTRHTFDCQHQNNKLLNKLEKYTTNTTPHPESSADLTHLHFILSANSPPFDPYPF